MEKRLCKWCKKAFYTYRCRSTLFCSNKCMGLSMRKSTEDKLTIIKKCKTCNKEFRVHPYRKNTAMYCSYSCGKKGKSAWNKGKKCFYLSNEKHHSWRGNKVNYYSLHSWINRNKGCPVRCEFCGVTHQEKKLCWANKDHKYTRNFNDYISLCYSCHKKYDLRNNS